MTDAATVTINHRAVKRLRGGHLWIYRSDIVDSEGADELSFGALVEMRDQRKRSHGAAWYSTTSQIALRSLAAGVPDDLKTLLDTRIGQAISARQPLDSGGSNACRLVHAEADLLPGLVVDRYGPVLSVQTPTQATDRHRNLIFDILEGWLSPAAIVERNDLSVRRYEDLEERSGVVRGELPAELFIETGGLRIPVDPLKGQKTGTFLDQFENHAAVAAYVNSGSRCLDAFTHTGGFALHMARAGGDVTGVDISGPALAKAAAAAAASGLDIEWTEANAFDFLKGAAKGGPEYDVVVIDPPAFAKSKRQLDGARRGYKEVNLRGIQLLMPGGVLVACSCSHNLSEAMLLDIVADAACDAGVRLQLLERRGASRDHPTLVGVPETAYLKCLIYRRVG